MKRAVVLTLLIAAGTLSVAARAVQGPPGGQAGLSLIFSTSTTFGGTAAAYPRTLTNAWNGLKHVDTIITGHSTTLPFSALEEYAAFNQDFLTWAQGELKAGKSVDEAVAGFKPSSPYSSYTVQPERLRSNVQTVYDESKK